MLATALFGMSFAVALLTLVDVLLSEQQKKRVADSAIRLWISLDQMKQLSFLNWLKSRGIQRWLVTLACAVSALPVIYILGQVVNPEIRNILGKDHRELFLTALLITGTGVGIWLGPPIAAFMLRGRSALGTLWRTGTVFFLAMIPVVAFLVFGMLVFAEHNFGGSEIYWVGALLFMIPLDFALWVFWAVAFIPLIAVYIVSASLSTCEFIVRRIAESPKGPVLAVSALLATVVAIFKTVGYG